MVGNDFKVMFVMNCREKLLHFLVVNRDDPPTFLAYQVVVDPLSQQLVDRRSGTHIGNGYFAKIHQTLQSTIDSGLIYSRQSLADFRIHLMGCQVGMLLG